MPWVELDEKLLENVTEREMEEIRQQARLKKWRSKFYADESVPRLAVEMLRAAGLRVATAGEAGLSGHADQDHLNYALRHGKVLLTCDTDFLNDTSYPLLQVPGMVVLEFGSGTTTEMRRTLRLIWPVVAFPWFHDRSIKLHVHPNGEYSVRGRTLNGGRINDRYRVFRNKIQVWRTKS